MSFLDYVTSNWGQIINLLLEHIKLTLMSVGIAILIGVPLGILVSYIKKLDKPILGAANLIQAIPSMALLGFMIPFLGIGKTPAVTAVILYSLLPIIKNTYTGLNGINPQTLEAAKGIGLTRFQVLTKVQLPMALPVIMTGVRISAVTAVGLMTMAAFIGAGGLGYLVFSGIRTVDNNQILAGAIPACLLALAVDYVIGMIENLVTPISLQKGDRIKVIKKRKIEKGVLAAFAVIILCICVGPAMFNTKDAKSSRMITMGCKDSTEQSIMANLAADIIEDTTDIKVNRRFELGGTDVIFSSLERKDIDMYIEYTGSAYSDIMKRPPITDMDKMYNEIKDEFKKKYNIEVLDYMDFNNTYVLAVTHDTAQKYNLKTVSDFSKYADKMNAGITFEFANREDGIKGMEKRYNFNIGKITPIDGAPRYTALISDEVDVIDAYSTDGLLKKFDLAVLKDDKNFFPPYNPAPIINEEALEKYPEIKTAMSKLKGLLNEETMIELNYKVDELHEKPSDVAREFLKNKGIV